MSRLMMDRAGVGPLRMVSRRIALDSSLIPPAHKADMADFLLKKLSVTDWGDTGQPTRRIAIPPRGTLESRVEEMLQFHNVTDNTMTPFEHVVSEEPVNYPSTSSLLESVTVKPTTGILYAYGIKIDPYQAASTFEFYCDQPNPEALVAVMAQGSNIPPLRMPSVNFAGAVYGLSEANRRIHRDGERLLTAVVAVETIVLLPGFIVSDPHGSLDRAADALVAAGVALS